MADDPLVTRDGCPVEVYEEFPTFGEPEWIHQAMRPYGSVLDLGAGVGRLADPIAGLGHRVIAVDDSEAMLARVTKAETLLGRIESLAIEERFDAVVLASHLLNTPDASLRTAFLSTIQRHLKPHGRAFIEWHLPAWFDHLDLGEHAAGRIGAVSSVLTVDAFDGRILRARMDYEFHGRHWVQPFAAERLSDADVTAAFVHAGLRAVSMDVPRPGWIVAESDLDEACGLPSSSAIQFQR